MTRRILLLTVLLLSAFFLYASNSVEAVTESPEESHWRAYVGTSYLVSHLGTSYAFNRMEVGATLYSGFPNLALISYLDDLDKYKNGEEGAVKPEFADYILPSFTLAFLGSVSLLCDVTPRNDIFDVFTGGSISFAYVPLFKGAVFSLDLVVRLQLNFGGHSGVYIATEAPLAGFLIVSSTEGNTVSPFVAIANADFLAASVALAAYTTRAGYIFRF